MNNIYYVYAYLRKSNGLPYYIGKGKGNRMFNKHHNNIPVPKDKSKIIKLIDNLPENDALAIEITFIFLLGKKHEGGILYNISSGGEGTSGMTHTKESRRKMSESRKGKKRKPHSEETKEKLRKANIGRKATPDHRRKMSESHKGLKQSKSTIKKRVSKLTGKTRSTVIKDKFKEINTGSGNPAYGKKWINNGVINKLVTIAEYNDKYVDWTMGRLMNKDPNTGKFI